jgi:hypothetical protein
MDLKKRVVEDMKQIELPHDDKDFLPYGNE